MVSRSGSDMMEGLYQERKERKARKDKIFFAAFAAFAFLGWSARGVMVVWDLTKRFAVFAAIALLLPIAILAAYCLTPPLARLDDAYIALHSARVVLSGHDPVFGAPALAGATSPVYVALLTAILGFGIATGDSALRLANALGIVAFAAGSGTLAELSSSRSAPLALVAVTLGSGVVVLFNLTNGLETGWAMATLTFAIASARAGRFVLAAGATGLLPFFRPDLAPASVIVLGTSFTGGAARNRSRRLPWPSPSRRRGFCGRDWTPGVGRPNRESEAAVPCGRLQAVDRKRRHRAARHRHGAGAIVPAEPGCRCAVPRQTRARRPLRNPRHHDRVPHHVSRRARKTVFRYLTAILVPWLCLGFSLSLSRVSARSRLASRSR